MSRKPILRFGQIWNINFGFLGHQIAFTLLMANTSRILSAFGADPKDLALFWLAPPLAGLILQPIVGYLSDRKWSRFGRRIPYLFVGSIITSILMFFMPHATILSHVVSPVLGGACVIFLLQCGLNVTMQPFRALVGDMVNPTQQNLGYSVQTLVGNIGGIAGSLLPFILTYIGLANQPIGSERLAPTVIWSFYLGSLFLLLTIMWTCFSVKEYTPAQLDTFEAEDDKTTTQQDVFTPKKETVISTMVRLSVVQFFAWFGAFFLWVYATDGIAETIWKTKDPLSEGYNEAANWYGVLTGIYCVVTAICSVFLAKMADRFGRKITYAVSLLIGALGLASIYFIHNQYLLILSVTAFGVGWAAILTFPYPIMAAVTPSKKMGLYMGLLNITIVIPQIAGALLGGLVFKYIAGEYSIAMLLVAGISLFLAAISVSLIKER